MRTVAFHTLGCKVNQYDAQAMLELFEKKGYVSCGFQEKADVYVIMTCTVTGTGDKKSLQAVRRALRNNPAADVVIAGCLAQRDGEKLLETTGARLVIGNARRLQVVELLEEAIKSSQRIAVVGDVLRIPYEPLTISAHEGHTRAVLKIQEGCDRYCTYCIIPYVRGGIRSRQVEEIAMEARRLAKAGFSELVLTGIHLTSFGRDLGDVTLLDGIRACMQEGIQRIRLGSLEPVIVTEEFVKALKETPVCPQFHLALQSGCDNVLQRMRRRYTTEEFRTACRLLRDAFPNCAITTDVICGFPGETEEEFAETCAFCREIGFARMHVFPYSARTGTKAAQMSGQVLKKVREERARQLILIGNELNLQYRQNMMGKQVQVLCEEIVDGLATGYTDSYIPCVFEQGEPGKMYMVQVAGLTEDGVKGEIVQ